MQIQFRMFDFAEVQETPEPPDILGGWAILFPDPESRPCYLGNSRMASKPLFPFIYLFGQILGNR